MIKIIPSNRFKYTKIFSISIFYSLFLTFYFPLDGSIIDRSNYVENSKLISLYYLNDGILSFLFNEPVLSYLLF